MLGGEGPRVSQIGACEMNAMATTQRLLIIDDSESIHPLIRARLNDFGIDSISAYNGIQGIEMASQMQPDLILLDVNMPDMNGFEVIKALKDCQETFNIPVIFLTGADDRDDKVTGLDMGAVDYITKPFEPVELRARVTAGLRTKKLLDLLTTEAEIDGLTGLHNRRFFDRRIKAELAACARYGRPVGLLLFDVDRFKQINDNHGHPMGDRVIQRIGTVLLESCRNTDLPCRYGGDEFVVLMTETSGSKICQAGHRVYDFIVHDEELSTMVRSQPVTISLGGASASSHRRLSPEQLVQLADNALYRAKEHGRNTCRFDEQDDDSSQRHRQTGVA